MIALVEPSDAGLLEMGGGKVTFWVNLADELIDTLDEIAEQQLRDSCHFCWTNWRDCVCDMQEGA